MKIAYVIADIPTQALDMPYAYGVGEDLEKDASLEVGCAVVIPFGARCVMGFVVDIVTCDEDNLPDGIDKSKLKYVQQIVSDSYFSAESAACAQWMAQHYIAPFSSCVRLFVPPGGAPRMARSSAGRWQIVKPKIKAADDRWVVLKPEAADFAPRKDAVRQAQVLDALRHGELRVSELATEFGSVSAVLKSLEQKGLVSIEHRRKIRGVPDDFDNSNFTPSEKPHLTAGQSEALEAIRRASQRGDGSVVLVDGVTGSGKTEIYLQAIEEVLAQGKTACVLVPEISLTPQTVARFRGRFGNCVAVLHSRMSDGERYDQWDLIRAGQARVVVGARSALFAPLANIGLIVIDEEHETSYKQESAPRYHAREVALWRARREGAAVVLGSATPSIESLYCADNDPSWICVHLSERANGRPLPKIEVIDRALEFSQGHRSIFSKRLTEAMREELTLQHKVVLLLNQRGFARFMLCRDCGFVPSCASCSTSLTYHEDGHVLVCHYCGYRQPVPAVCPECNSPYLKLFGAGTQRVEDDLRVLLEQFSDIPEQTRIIRMDADTTKTKGAHQALLEEFMRPGAAVLLGTQMIAKGLDFDDVTLVGVINADTQLNLPDYRASERTFDLIEQVAGRAGRAQLEGRVMIQTYQSDSVAIQAAARYDRALFLNDELPKRRELGYPPYKRLINVLVWGAEEEKVRAGAQQLQADLVQHVRDWATEPFQVLSATPCVLSRLRKTYRWHILIRAPKQADVSEVLLPFFRARKSSRDFRIAVDIDPMSLL